jgi:predicted RNase H-like HicB family nuclease
VSLFVGFNREEKMPKVTINATLPAKIYKEGDVWVSICPILDVASQGCTKQEAKENLQEAIHLFMETCFEMGTLMQVMQDCSKALRLTFPYHSSFELNKTTKNMKEKVTHG